MNIQGLVKSSLIDYTGYASTVLFCGGCCFRCGYCHNPDLAEAAPGGPGRFPADEVLQFLRQRQRFIDAVCVTGGEPTLQADLADFLAEVRKLGLLIKLDTNGARPTVLSDLISAGLVDYVALDIKAPLDRYSEIAGRPVAPEMILASAKIVLAVDHEYRTTVCREQLTEADLKRLANDFPKPKRWYLQRFRNPGRILEAAAAFSAYEAAEMERLGEILCASVR